MIIDSHVHIGIFEDIDRIVNMSKEIVLESMDLYHIDFALVSNAAVEYDCQWNLVPQEKQKSQEEYFEEAIAFAKANPTKIGVLPWVKPAYEQVTEKLEALIQENRQYVYGIKVHPFHSKIAFDSPQVEEFIKLAQKYQLPVITHTADCDEASSVRVYNMAKKYPDVNFVMAHMDLGTDNQTAIEMLGKLPNLYGDTTWVSLESTVQAIRLYGSKKILFGSDNPIDGVHTYGKNPKGEPSLYQRYFHELEDIIGKDAYEDLMYKNAMRVFKIKLDETKK